jgi:hypothetical protein
MLAPTTPEALTALDQAAKLPRWNDVNNLIEAELKATLDRIIGSRDDAELHELRGRAKAFRDFQQLVRDAPAMLKRLGLTSPL